MFFLLVLLISIPQCFVPDVCVVARRGERCGLLLSRTPSSGFHTGVVPVPNNRLGTFLLLLFSEVVCVRSVLVFLKGFRELTTVKAAEWGKAWPARGHWSSLSSLCWLLIEGTSLSQKPRGSVGVRAQLDVGRDFPPQAGVQGAAPWGRCGCVSPALCFHPITDLRVACWTASGRSTSVVFLPQMRPFPFDFPAAGRVSQTLEASLEAPFLRPWKHPSSLSMSEAASAKAKPPPSPGDTTCSGQ